MQPEPCDPQNEEWDKSISNKEEEKMKISIEEARDAIDYLSSEEREHEAIQEWEKRGKVSFEEMMSFQTLNPAEKAYLAQKLYLNNEDAKNIAWRNLLVMWGDRKIEDFYMNDLIRREEEGEEETSFLLKDAKKLWKEYSQSLWKADNAFIRAGYSEELNLIYQEMRKDEAVAECFYLYFAFKETNFLLHELSKIAYSLDGQYMEEIEKEIREEA